MANVARRLPKEIPKLQPGSGTGQFWKRSAKIIRMIRHGCTNRPFYHISVIERKKPNCRPVIEQLGTFDPVPNINNEKLCALNIERIKYWIGKGAHLSRPTAELFGLSGFLPIHPRVYMKSWRIRQTQEAEALKEQAKSEDKTT